MIETNLIEATVNKIQKLLAELPDLPTGRKNIYELAGISSREEVNSNMLAFYLDKQEEHRMGPLFLESLMELACPEQSLTEYEYEVIREHNNIDILIASRNADPNPENPEEFEWAVIIENKIYHILNNNLTGYWNQVNVKQGGFKLGIVLSPYGQPDSEKLRVNTTSPVYFVDVKHSDLTEKVKEKLPPYFLEADDRHLLLLKEYISNVESMYRNESQIKTMDDRLKIYQKHFEQINEILSLRHELRDHVINETIRVMETFGFEPANTSTKVQGKLFFRKEGSGHSDFFRIYFSYPTLIDQGKLNVQFELHKDFKKYGSELHGLEEFKKLVESSRPLVADKSYGPTFHHVVKYKDFSFQQSNSSNSFFEDLKRRLHQDIFNPENGFFVKCSKLLEKVMTPEDYARGTKGEE